MDISTFKSCAPGSDRKIEVYCVKGADCVTLRMFSEGGSLTIDLSIADAIDLAHTIEDLADSEGGEQPTAQEPKPQLIDAVTALADAVFYVQDDLRDLRDRWSLSTKGTSLAIASLHRAGKVLLRLREAQ